MTVDVSPATIGATYSYLRTLRPFSGWGFPPEADIRFDILKSRSWMGDCTKDPLAIRVCQTRVGHLDTLIRVVAHEMCHLKEIIDGAKNWTQHSKHWHARANEVCSEFGFDPKEF